MFFLKKSAVEYPVKLVPVADGVTLYLCLRIIHAAGEFILILSLSVTGQNAMFSDSFEINFSPPTLIRVGGYSTHHCCIKIKKKTFLRLILHTQGGGGGVCPIFYGLLEVSVCIKKILMRVGGYPPLLYKN